MTRLVTINEKHSQTGLLLGLFLFTIYLLSYRGGFHSVDEVSTFAVTESLVKFGTLNTDQIAWTQWVTTQAEAQGFFGADGHVYSKKGLAISLAQAPLYGLALLVPNIGMLQIVSLLNAILTAWTAALIYGLLRRFDLSSGAALTTALLYGLGTIAWVYAKYMFSGTLAGFLLIVTLYLLVAYRQQGRRWRLALAGFCGGLTVLARANNLILLLFFGLYLLAILWMQYRQGKATNMRSLLTGQLGRALLAFVASTALAGAILLWYNWARSGNPFQTGYDLTIFSPNILVGLYKLLFSPLRGLFIYSPILMMAIPGWFWLYRRFRAEAWLVLALVGSTVLLFSAWSSGEGLSWGSRFLVPIVPLWVIALAPMIARFWQMAFWQRALISGLSLLSVGIQMLGISINPWVYLNELQAQFGGEFFLERTAALTDYSTTQILGQLRFWQATNSDLIWWQSHGFDWLAFAISLSLVLLVGWGLYKASSGQTSIWLSPLLLLLTLSGTFVLLNRYYYTDPQFNAPDHAYLQALNQAAQATPTQQPIITVAQYSYHLPMNYFKPRIPLLGFAQNEEPLPDTATALLTDAVTNGTEPLWLVTVGRQPADPTNRVEAWLAQNAFKVSDHWLEETRQVSYGLPLLSDTMQVQAQLGSHLSLLEQQRPSQIEAGRVLPVTFKWQATAPDLADYRVFIQLIDINGGLVAQQDSWPQGGYLPTSQWPLNVPIVDQHGLALPVELPAGDYRLIAGLYQPNDGQRLLNETGTDFIDLGIVTVIP